MPEGDTIFRAAATLHRVLAGKQVTRFESVYPAITRVADDQPIVGRTIQSVSARGKHLLIAFSGDLILRTHMRMNGSWHIYPTGARWQRPTRDMRVLVATSDAVAIGFNVPDAEWVQSRDLSRHRALGSLGPDLLAPDAEFDAADALRRLRLHESDPIGDTLLNQRVVAGIGNVFKSEILFLAGIEPFTRVGALSDVQLQQIVAIARTELAANVMGPSQTLSPAIGRRTTRSLNPGESLWVYGRGGKRCRRCGTTIRMKKSGIDARPTYWCPACQIRLSASTRV